MKTLTQLFEEAKHAEPRLLHVFSERFMSFVKRADRWLACAVFLEEFLKNKAAIVIAHRNNEIEIAWNTDGSAILPEGIVSGATLLEAIEKCAIARGLKNGECN